MIERREFSIVAQDPDDTSFRFHMAMRMVSMSIWPFERDDRISILMTVLSAEVAPLIETEDHIDAILDLLRMQMRAAKWREWMHHEQQRA